MMGWNRNSLVARSFGLEDDVAARLVDHLIAPKSTKDVGEVLARKITGDFHATDRTSSRTRWSRIREGGV